MRADESVRGTRTGREIVDQTRRLSAAALALGLVGTAGLASATEATPPASFDAPLQAPPASLDPRFDPLPSELSSQGRLDRETLAVPADPLSPVLMLDRPVLGPLVMEQPMRLYENDVTVKLRAPGGRSSFATLELVF